MRAFSASVAGGWVCPVPGYREWQGALGLGKSRNECGYGCSENESMNAASLFKAAYRLCFTPMKTLIDFANTGTEGVGAPLRGAFGVPCQTLVAPSAGTAAAGRGARAGAARTLVRGLPALRGRCRR